jgi:hypothetical protein
MGACSLRETIKSTPYKLSKSFNDYENTIQTSLVYNPIILSNASDYIGFLPVQIKKKMQKYDVAYYFIVLSYAGRTEIGIKEGESLTLKVDGKRITLSSEKGSWEDREKEYFGYDLSLTKERAEYRIYEKELLEIINASNVVMTVKGREQTITGEFLPENFVLMREFFNEVMKKDYEEYRK